ncbi:Rpn family recombination-promoting nuclease/putative transposase, partial [uncultured Brachyspira sp.]|uniref:Rpn family recombination-promoting nuclease/putative transposase n=1 Tax=uncultured Brachyspira sp. TaxID=221953 RepID=UPI00260B3092
IDTEDINVSLDMIQMHILEIPRFINILNNSSIDDFKKNKILSWIDFFTAKDFNDDEKDKLKEANNIMSKVIDKYERFISSKEEMEVYNARDAFLYGQTVMLEYEREEGKKEGIEIGFQQGIEKGIKENQILIAKNLKKSGLDAKFISENTGLSLDEIEKL